MMCIPSLYSMLGKPDKTSHYVETKCGVETSTSEQSAATHEKQMEKLLTQLRDADIIHEMGNDDEM